MSAILAIDPGTEVSGWVIYDPVARAVLESGTAPNDGVVLLIERCTKWDDRRVAIESFESMGMAVGREVFEAVWWSGRFAQCALDRRARLRRVTRREVKLHLCGSSRAKDANVRQALLDKLGGKGTKKAPGPLYGVSSHAWAALAVAVTAHETPA